MSAARLRALVLVFGLAVLSACGDENLSLCDGCGTPSPTPTLTPTPTSTFTPAQTATGLTATPTVAPTP
jgi:hypothetical protein